MSNIGEVTKTEVSMFVLKENHEMDYERYGMDLGEWPETVETYPPVPMKQCNDVMKQTFEKFNQKIESRPDYPFVTKEHDEKFIDEWFERAEKETIAELNESGALPFEIAVVNGGWFPKNPWKEIDGCIVVRKDNGTVEKCYAG
jgi:hypothetical protein